MDDVASAHSENINLQKILQRLMQWEKTLAPLSETQLTCLKRLEDIDQKSKEEIDENISPEKSEECERPIDSTPEFLDCFDRVEREIHEKSAEVYRQYYSELATRRSECDRMLEQIKLTLDSLAELENEYKIVSNKTSSLNSGSERLIAEQKQLIEIADEIKNRLYYFTQADQILQLLQSPTISVSSEIFAQTLDKIDKCIAYIREHSSFKDSSTFTSKYNQCLAKAVLLIKNNLNNLFTNTAEQIVNLKQTSTDEQNSDTAFAIYYGKFQGIAPKANKIISLVEQRLDQNVEYEALLGELQRLYLFQRAGIMSNEVEAAIKKLTTSYKGDHCALVRSACAFMVHVSQDEHRLFYQFFSRSSFELTVYLEGICTILYDTLRPFIIHINHLETLAEICSILRVEMLDEHVQQNPEALEALGKICLQLLQDVQERLVFRAHLYLQSDILNYKPSAGDLAYPEKLEMMQNIASSLNESTLRSSASMVSLSSISSKEPRQHQISRNSPADLHGMWYPTVRRTLVCLSRLYRCIERPVFQSLSQQALSHCIQSISAAAQQISTNKTPIDGELFEIKHLLIIREQIAPFRVDFTVRETSLDFSKTKTAAFGLLQKRKQLFSMDSNNSLLEFLFDGAPQVKEHVHDSRKDVDRHLKQICETFIKDATHLLIGPIVTFIERAQTLLKNDSSNVTAATPQQPQKINYVLRQSPWASPQQISGFIQESQRLIKGKLAGLQRAMQLYLSNKDTEFILFRPIRNNIISAFVRLEQLLSANGYTKEDLIIASCPSPDQISILLSSASLASESSASMNEMTRKISTTSISSNDGVGRVSRKVSINDKVTEFGEKTVEEEKETTTEN